MGLGYLGQEGGDSLAQTLLFKVLSILFQLSKKKSDLAVKQAFLCCCKYLPAL